MSVRYVKSETPKSAYSISGNKYQHK